MFFWVFPRRRFGTMYQFHLQRLEVDFQPLKMELIHGSETSAYYILTPGKTPKEHIQNERLFPFCVEGKLGETKSVLVLLWLLAGGVKGSLFI